ncbi:co-chaperone GroES [Xylocopilactobacillus apicola]|uniref:Co-chaperonin GroES n=1 Tax=Xylocopilactobacillus apicola TaxID=2932184 RepID=A0AAU9DAW1_9LACO|nr:co-chaperone GroES [Xylocopilactobacillus apicola]BDR59591.1 10 kDa chaperonin [Xylocopilactobacillus apicola]
MLKPLGDRVLVKVRNEEEKVGGIVLAGNAKEKPTSGEVIAVGPGAIDHHGNRMPIDVKVGETVWYDKYSGTSIKYNDDEYLVIRAGDLLAVED